nr:MAG TPA: hypothetical protein [Bacteriophage sp.]
MRSILTVCLKPRSLIVVPSMIVWSRLHRLLLRFLKLCMVIVILISCVVVIKLVFVVHMLSQLTMRLNDIK